MGHTGVCGEYKCPIINSSYVTVGYILCGTTVLYIQSAFFSVLVHVYCTSSAYSDRYFFMYRSVPLRSLQFHVDF
jgi:hypothetical protein